jgi:LysR family transcriptional regulator, hydrogen peroxide-inducible genes activator
MVLIHEFDECERRLPWQASPMTPVQAQQVLAVARHQSFSRAARALGASQATVSNAVAVVERSLGVQLFRRTTRQVTPTPAFRALRRGLERLVRAEQAIVDAAAKARLAVSPELKVGVSPVVDAARLDPLLASFERRHPTIGVALIELNLRELEQALASGAVDVAIAPVSGRSAFKSFVLYREPLLVVGGLVVGQPVALRSLSEAAIIMMPDACGLARATVRLFREGRVPLRRAKTLALGYQLLEHAALRGRGHAVLPRSKLTAATRAQPVLRADGSPAQLEVRVLQRRTAVTRPQQQLSAMLRAYRD